MKKTLKILGVLVVALALSIAFVACAQPTDEGEGANSNDTILRLWLEDTAQTGQLPLDVNDQILIVLASYTSARWNNLTKGAQAEAVEDTVGDPAFNKATDLRTAMASEADGAGALLQRVSLSKGDSIAAPDTVGSPLATRTAGLYNVIGVGIQGRPDG